MVCAFPSLFFMCVSHSVMSDSATLWTVACQAPLFVGFLLEGIAMPFSRGSSRLRDGTWTPCIGSLDS